MILDLKGLGGSLGVFGRRAGGPLTRAVRFTLDVEGSVLFLAIDTGTLADLACWGDPVNTSRHYEPSSNKNNKITPLVSPLIYTQLPYVESAGTLCFSTKAIKDFNWTELSSDQSSLLLVSLMNILAVHQYYGS